MKKVDSYFLVARDRLLNEYKIVSIYGVRGLTLEEIDLFTTHFKNENELEKMIGEEPSVHGTDFFIIHKNNKQLQKYEVLYDNNDFIRPIAEDFINGTSEKSIEKIDAILDSFANKMFKMPLFYEQVVTGRTGIYPKYANYFIANKSKPSTIKYREGGWGRKTYPLIRNIVEATSRKSYNYTLLCDKLYRSLLDDKLLQEADPKYNPDQLSLFDDIDLNTIDDDKLLNVIGTFVNLPTATIFLDDDRAYFDKSIFNDYQKGDLEKLQEYLPQELLLRIRLLLIQRDCMDNSFEPYKNRLYRPIERGQKDLVELFKNHPEMLDRADLWCKLYHSYEEKMLGDVSGREYKKRWEC